MRDRIEIEYGLKAELGKMRVAYRESVSKTAIGELTLEKNIGGTNYYAQMKMEIETTLGEYDIQDI